MNNDKKAPAPAPSEAKWVIAFAFKKDDGKPYWLTLHDPEGWWRAEVKWDGCVHFYRYYNEPMDPAKPDREEDMDYIHLCGVDDVIELLTELRGVAQKAGMWPEGKDNGM